MTGVQFAIWKIDSICLRYFMDISLSGRHAKMHREKEDSKIFEFTCFWRQPFRIITSENKDARVEHLVGS